MTQLLEAVDLRITAGLVELVALDSFSVAAGECVTVVGPNGAGKSTLARCLAGLHRPIKGTVTINGEDLYTTSSIRRAELVAFVPQRVSQLPPFTVRHFLEMSRYRIRDRRAQKCEEVIERCLRTWNLEDFSGRLLSELSGGELQRVLLCGAAAQEPAVLILDEPTTFLDVTSREVILECLAVWLKSERRTLVVVTHDLVALDRLSNRIAGMKTGRIVGVAGYGSGTELTILEQVFERSFIRVGIPDSRSSVIVPVSQ